MHSKIAGLIAHLLCAAGPQTVAETPSNLPWEALPVLSEASAYIEGAALFHDLRAIRAWSEHVHDELREIPVGAALVDDPAPMRTGGEQTVPDISEQLQDVDDWLDIAAPGDAPVPATLSILGNGNETGWEAAMKLAPGVAERLAKRHAAVVTNEEHVWSLTQKGRTFFVRQDAQGWLRVAAEMRWLGTPQGSTPSTMLGAQATLAGSDVAFILTSKSTFVRRFAAEAPSLAARIAAQNVRAGGIGWRIGSDNTTQLRLVIDAPALESVKPMLARRNVPDLFTRTLGDHVVGLAVAVIPDALKRTVPNLLRMRMAQTAAPLPAAMNDPLANLEGHLAFASYDAPGDWVIAARFNAPTFANAMLDGLRAWLHTVSAAYMSGGQQVVTMEPLPGTPNGVLHVRPAPHMEGPYLAARGSTLLFVQQRSRLQQLLTIDDPAQTPAPYDDNVDAMPSQAGLFAMPITPLMREALAGPHLLSVYHILGSDGAWGDYLAWMANRWQSPVEGAQQDPLLAPVMTRLPQWFGAMSYLWMCSYDVAITADVKKSALVIDVTRSEI